MCLGSYFFFGYLYFLLYFLPLGFSLAGGVDAAAAVVVVVAAAAAIKGYCIPFLA